MTIIKETARHLHCRADRREVLSRVARSEPIISHYRAQGKDLECASDMRPLCRKMTIPQFTDCIPTFPNSSLSPAVILTLVKPRSVIASRI